MTLKEIRLGHGDHPGFDIDLPGWTGNKQKLSSKDWAGFEGIRVIGEGPGLTHIRPVVAGSAPQDSTIFVAPFNGILQLENLTLHGAPRKALHMGLARPVGSTAPRYPKFGAKLRGVEIHADPPPRGMQHSTVWGTFGYECNWDLEDVVYWYEFSAEHPHYAHGFGSLGLSWKRVRVEGSGAECCKNTARPTETRWTKGARIKIDECSFKNWNQPWSWRGGAGLTVQGAGVDVLVERSLFYGGDGKADCRCIAIDDSGAEHYSSVTGKAYQGPANGLVVLRSVGMSANGSSDFPPLLKVGSLIQGSTTPIVRGLLIEGCGVFGRDVAAHISEVPKGQMMIRNCNTPGIEAYCAAAGLDTATEAKINAMGGPFADFSKGATG